MALRVRWLWLKATEDSRPWRHLHLPADVEAQAIFNASTSWIIGNGTSCLFWTDRWVAGQSISEIAPAMLALVPKRRRRVRSMSQGLSNRAWIQDF